MNSVFVHVKLIILPDFTSSKLSLHIHSYFPVNGFALCDLFQCKILSNVEVQQADMVRIISL